MKYLFYRFQSDSVQQQIRDVDQSFWIVSWKPSLCSVVPDGIPIKPYAVWWGFHYTGLFYNRDYSLLLIYKENELIHRSCIFPGNFRFPFMRKDDIQIGDTCTNLNYRGRGLATYAIQKCIELFQKANRDFWYIVAEDNIPSIKAVEKAGFTLTATGIRKKRCGISLLGYYEPQFNK